MTIEDRFSPLATRPSVPTLKFATVALILLTSGSPWARAQQMIASVRPADLPEAPSSIVSQSSSLPATPQQTRNPGESSAPLPTNQPMASTSDKYIAPGQPVPTLSAGNKVALGIKDAISPLSFIGWALTAGYEQGTNGSPNYGTNAPAFGQRFGAAAARSSSEGIFSDSIMAPILHEDPRYYRMGPGNNFFKRAAYAATRTLVSRTDGGHATPNLALLSGTLGGAYLTKAYYPALNTSNSEVLTTFAGSLGGSALGFAASEFLSGTLNFLHISRPAQN